MAMRIDHVVVRVAKLEAGMAEFRGRGFTVTPGGAHPDFGSHNALVPFEDGSYLELIATLPGATPAAPESAPARRFASWLGADDGVVDWALLPDDIGAAVANARSRGLALEGPMPGRRLRPDGVEVAWAFAFPEMAGLPFLCADVTPRERRVPPGEARLHANGALGIAALTVGAPEPAALAHALAALADATAERDGDRWRVALDGAVIEIVEAERAGPLRVKIEGIGELSMEKGD